MYLRVLAEGGFDMVSEGIGEALGFGRPRGKLPNIHRGEPRRTGVRAPRSRGGVHHVIIPPLLDDDAPPELILWDDREYDMRGGLN